MAAAGTSARGRRQWAEHEAHRFGNRGRESNRKPDIAFIHLGVVTEGKTAEAAQSANAEIFAKVREVLFEQFAMKEKDVQTISFRVRPNYIYKEGEDPEISSYTATQTIQISYRKLSRIGEVLDAVAKAGVNRVDSVQFATEKAEQYQLEALQAAMKNARQKAEALAAAENETIKGVVRRYSRAQAAAYIIMITRGLV